MASFAYLPNEIIIEIIELIVPCNQCEPIIGVNAPWTALHTFQQSLKRAVPSGMTEGEPDTKNVLIYAELLALRSTSSKLNSLCIPFLYTDLNVIKNFSIQFEEFYNLIIVPYAQQIKTLRLSLDVAALSDKNVAQILSKTTNLKSLSLYHHDFESPASPRAELRANSLAEPNWMHHTNQSIIRLLEEKGLDALGIYSLQSINNYPGLRTDRGQIGPMSLLSDISRSPSARKSLKFLDIVLPTISTEVYAQLRQDLTSLTSLIIVRAFRLHLGGLWNPAQPTMWADNANLTCLKLKQCRGVYAPHIPHLVRHFGSLQHLLVSICGDYADDPIYTPPQGWFSASDALWKVRRPLDRFHLEHMAHWEIGVMAEIPTKTLIITNLLARDLIGALKDDANYFPKLEKIRTERNSLPRGKGTIQLSVQHLETLEAYCRERGIVLLQDAESTSSYPRQLL